MLVEGYTPKMPYKSPKILPTHSNTYICRTTILGNWLYSSWTWPTSGSHLGRYPQSKTVSASQKPIITLDPWKIKGWYLKTEPWKQKIPLYIYISNIEYETAMTKKTIFRFQLLVFMRITFALGAFLLEPSQGLEQHPLSRWHDHRLHHRQRARASRFWRLTGAHRWSAEGASETKQPGSPSELDQRNFLDVIKILWETEWLQKEMFVFSGF